MKSKSVRRISIWLVTALLVLGCALPFLTNPAPVQVGKPTVQQSDLLETIVVQTVAAAQTQTTTALPSPTLTPTITFTPTATFTSTPTFFFALPTSTPFPSVTPSGQISIGGTVISGTPKKSIFTGEEWTCLVVDKQPKNGAKIKAGHNFYATWTIINTGTKTWPNTGIDFVRTGGYDGIEGRPIQDLSLTITPGNKITLKVLITAPKKLDTFSVFWSLKVGQTHFCQMKVSFEIVK